MKAGLYDIRTADLCGENTLIDFDSDLFHYTPLDAKLDSYTLINYYVPVERNFADVMDENDPSRYRFQPSIYSRVQRMVRRIVEFEDCMDEDCFVDTEPAGKALSSGGKGTAAKEKRLVYHTWMSKPLYTLIKRRLAERRKDRKRKGLDWFNERKFSYKHFDENTPVFKIMLLVSYPIVITQLLLGIYGFVDMILISTLNGEAPLFSYVSILPIQNILCILPLVSLGTGAATIIAPFLGQNNVHKSEVIYAHMFFYGLLISIAVPAICIPLRHVILQASGITEHYIGLADRYSLVAFSLMPLASFLDSGMIPVLRCQNKTLTAMTRQLIGILLNIILDLVLIIGFRLSVVGVAWANAVSTLVAGFLIVSFFFKPVDYAKVRAFLSARCGCCGPRSSEDEALKNEKAVQRLRDGSLVLKDREADAFTRFTRLSLFRRTSSIVLPEQTHNSQDASALTLEVTTVSPCPSEPPTGVLGTKSSALGDASDVEDTCISLHHSPAGRISTTESTQRHSIMGPVESASIANVMVPPIQESCTSEISLDVQDSEMSSTGHEEQPGDQQTAPAAPDASAASPAEPEGQWDTYRIVKALPFTVFTNGERLQCVIEAVEADNLDTLIASILPPDQCADETCAHAGESTQQPHPDRGLSVFDYLRKGPAIGPAQNAQQTLQDPDSLESYRIAPSTAHDASSPSATHRERNPSGESSLSSPPQTASGGSIEPPKAPELSVGLIQGSESQPHHDEASWPLVFGTGASASLSAGLSVDAGPLPKRSGDRRSHARAADARISDACSISIDGRREAQATLAQAILGTRRSMRPSLAAVVTERLGVAQALHARATEAERAGLKNRLMYIVRNPFTTLRSKIFKCLYRFRTKYSHGQILFRARNLRPRKDTLLLSLRMVLLGLASYLQALTENVTTIIALAFHKRFNTSEKAFTLFVVEIIAERTINLFKYPLLAFASGILPVLGFNMGAGRRIRVYIAIKAGTLILFVVTMAEFVLLQTLAEAIASLYRLDHEVEEEIAQAIRTMSSTLYVAPFNSMALMLLQLGGKEYQALGLELLRFVAATLFQVVYSLTARSTKWIMLADSIGEAATFVAAIFVYLRTLFRYKRLAVQDAAATIARIESTKRTNLHYLHRAGGCHYDLANIGGIAYDPNWHEDYLTVPVDGLLARAAAPRGALEMTDVRACTAALDVQGAQGGQGARGAVPQADLWTTSRNILAAYVHSRNRRSSLFMLATPRRRMHSLAAGSQPGK